MGVPCVCRRREAPRREPVGRRAVGQERPPEARETAHHQPAQNASTNKQSTHLKPSAGFGVAGAISPDACYGHPALRCARRKPRFAILATLGFLRRLDRHRPPLANPRFRVLVCVDAIEAPRREPGGRRAVGPPNSRSPPHVHHPPAKNACSTKSPTGLVPPDGGPLGLPGPRKPAQPLTTNPLPARFPCPLTGAGRASPRAALPARRGRPPPAPCRPPCAFAGRCRSPRDW